MVLTKCPICGLRFDERHEGECDRALDRLYRELLHKGTTEYLMLKRVKYNGKGVKDEGQIWICASCSERLMNNLREDGVIE